MGLVLGGELGAEGEEGLDGVEVEPAAEGAAAGAVGEGAFGGAGEAATGRLDWRRRTPDLRATSGLT